MNSIDLLRSVVETPVTQAAAGFPTNENVSAALASFAPINVAFKSIETELKVLRDNLENEVWPLWVGELWKLKKHPGNPRLKSEDENEECLFVVPEAFNFKLPKYDERTEKPEDVLANLLSVHGIANPHYLIAEEFEFNVGVSLNLAVLPDHLIKSFILYLSGTNKTLRLTGMETEAVNKCKQTSLTLTVRKGVFDRICSYCSDEAQLRKLLDMLEPKVTIKSVKFGLRDSKEDREEKMMLALQEVLGKEEAK